MARIENIHSKGAVRQFCAREMFRKPQETCPAVTERPQAGGHCHELPMSLQQNGWRSFAPVQFALQVLRAKALGLMGSSKIMFMTDCKLNKIPLPLKKGFAEVCKVCLLEMPPHVVLAPSWQGPSRVLVPWPWEGKPLPAPTSTLEFPLDVESTRMVWRVLLQCLAPISKAGTWPHLPLEAAAGRRRLLLQGEARAQGRKPSWNSQLRKGPGPRFCF